MSDYNIDLREGRDSYLTELKTNQDKQQSVSKKNSLSNNNLKKTFKDPVDVNEEKNNLHEE